MARTQLTGLQVGDSSVQRSDLDSITTGQAVVKKLIAGENITFSYTGVDEGTGDVTINSTSSMSSIHSINAATSLIQTQRIMVKLVSNGQL